ncbi:hypothetical protein GCM10009678_50060 [Actinomadura kijaniata]
MNAGSGTNTMSNDSTKPGPSPGPIASSPSTRPVSAATACRLRPSIAPGRYRIRAFGVVGEGGRGRPLARGRPVVRGAWRP